MSEYLRKKQIILKKLLIDIMTVCIENQINAWIDSGTLLGIEREGDLLHWDDDIDICVLREDYNRFSYLIEHEENLFITTKYYVKNGKFFKINKVGYYGYFDFCLADIFIMDLVDKENIDEWFCKKKKVSNHIFQIIGSKRNTSFFCYETNDCLINKIDAIIYKNTSCNSNDLDRLVLTYGIGEIFPKKCFYINISGVIPLQICRYYEHFIIKPNFPCEYLTNMYGDNYMTPNQSNFIHYKMNDFRIHMLNN